jgi:hypothetical protein
MNDSDLLLAVAEIAVAFAAFSGLVSVLGQAQSSVDPRAAAARLQSVLLNSLLATCFALLPFLPARLGASQPVTWRLCSGLFATAWLAYLIWVVRRYFHLRQVGVEPRSFATPLSAVNLGLYVLGILGLASGALGLIPSLTQGAYLFGLYVLLLAAGTVFVQLFLSLLGEPK